MKKMVLILLVLLFSISIVTGCANEGTKTEEEIRAEIRAEIEAEIAAENAAGDVGKDTGANMDQDVVTDADTGANTDQDVKTDTDDSSNGEAEALLTFNEVYDGNNLIEAFEYFSEHFYDFEEDEKTDYAAEAYDEYLTKYDLNLIQSLTYDIGVTPMGDITPENSDVYYSYYSMEYRMLNVAMMDEETAEMVQAIHEDDFYTLAAVYWASAGNVDGMITFRALPKPEHLLAFNRVYSSAKDYAIHTYLSWGLEDGDFNSSLIPGMPVVYIDRPDCFSLFANEDVWKTDVVLPIDNVVDVEEELDESKLFLSDLYPGYILDRHVVVNAYNEDDSYGLVLDGEFTVSGAIKFDGAYGQYIFTADESPIYPSKIWVNDDIGFTVFDYCAIDNGEDIALALGDLAPSEYGEEVQVEMVVGDYSYYGTLGAAGIHSGGHTDFLYFVSVNGETDANNTGIGTGGLDNYYTNETIDGTFIDFGEYRTVIIPMYYGDNICMVDYDYVEIEENGTFMGNFTVFGMMNDVVITYNGYIDSADVVIELGEVTNTDVNIYGAYAGDMSNILVTGNVLLSDGSYEAVEFTLSDMIGDGGYGIYTFEK